MNLTHAAAFALVGWSVDEEGDDLSRQGRVRARAGSTSPADKLEEQADCFQVLHAGAVCRDLRAQRKVG
jgi:hypothetical protein